MYELRADDVTLWRGQFPPTQAHIDRAAIRATLEGWNGTELEIHRDGKLTDRVYPSPEALE